MAQTTISGPFASGDKAAGITGGPNIGLATLSQTAVQNFDTTLVQNTTFYLPPSSIITAITVDVLTAFNSATSATTSAGTATGGTQYMSSVNAKTAGRAAPTLSAAQLLAMSNVSTNTTLVVTTTSVGQPTAGQLFIRVEYIQTIGI